MNATRWRHVSSSALLWIVAACSAAGPSVDPGASSAAGASSNTAPPPTASAAPTAPAATASGPLGGGLLLVYQLDGTSPEAATTETVYALDLGSGAKTVFGSLPVTDETCCPTEVRYSSDHTQAFLFSTRLRGVVDVRAGTVEPFAARVPNYGILISNRGDRLAWIDDITGTSETIVIADLAGKVVTRLTLPEGAWRSIAAWSPDDTALAVTTYLPIRTGLAPDMRLASIVACCTIDRGPEVTHLLIVPVDGSPVREVLDNTADVTKDQLVPIPSRPPTVVGDAPKVSRNLDVANWSPDGRSVLLTGGVCPPSWGYRYPAGSCTYTFYLVDVETGVRTIAAEMHAPIMGMAWSPDARRMAYIGVEGDKSGLYVMDRDGKNRARLTDAAEGGISWSPDGTWIAFWRINPAVPEGQNRIEVWAVPVHGGEARLVAAHATAGW